MSSFYCCSFFMLALLASMHLNNGDSVFDYEYGIEQVDKYIDGLISEVINGNNKQFSPYKLNDIHYPKSRIPFTNIITEAKISHGAITGFESLRRLDQSSIDLDGHKLIISADLVAGPLNFHYDGFFQISNHQVSVIIQKTMEQAEFHVDISVDAFTGLNATLTKFKVLNMKSTDSKITGLNGFPIVRSFMDLSVNFWFELAMRNLFEEVHYAIAEKILTDTLPVIETDFLSE